MDAKSALDYAAKHNAKILDVRFIDIQGVCPHVSFQIHQLPEG